MNPQRELKRPAHYIPVMGTWDLDNAYGWWRKDSAFSQYAESENIVLFPRPPFIWSSDIDGVFELVGKNTYSDWRAAGASLSYYLENIQHSHRNIIAHSHGLQVVACAIFFFGVDIRTLTTIGSPIRKDFYPQYSAIQNKCDRWQHIYDTKFDLFGQLGMLFDGTLSFDRSCPFATRNVAIENIAHTDILEGPDSFKYWTERNLFDFIR